MPNSDHQVFGLFKHLFGRFVAHREWDSVEMEQASVPTFYIWLVVPGRTPNQTGQWTTSQM